ncbi:MAG: sigma-70 family RNA polymerase sigma factor [Planctomycetota bacterium]
MNQDERDRLLHRWQERGDREALGELLLYETRTIRAILVRRGSVLPDRQNGVSDVVQEVGLRLLQREGDGLPTFRDSSALRGYLLKTAWGLCIDRYRRAGRSPVRVSPAGADSFRQDPSTTGGLGEVEHRDFSHALQITLNVLPEAEQRILELYDLKSWSFEAIAREVGLPSADAVRMRRKRALARLAPTLAKWLDILVD